MRTNYSPLQREALGIAVSPGTSADRTVAMHAVQRGSELPFAVESTAPFAAASKAKQTAIAKSVAKAKDAGLSGDEMRAVFGALLSGPARRKLLRTASLADGRIAPSYDAYRDGDARIGSRHAKEHGAEALARREAEEKAAASKARRAEKAAARKAAKAAAAAEAASTADADAAA